MQRNRYGRLILIEELMIDTALNKGIAYLPDELTQKFLAEDDSMVIRKLDSKRRGQEYSLKFVYRKDNKSKALKQFVAFLKNNQIKN